MPKVSDLVGKFSSSTNTNNSDTSSSFKKNSTAKTTKDDSFPTPIMDDSDGFVAFDGFPDDRSVVSGDLDGAPKNKNKTDDGASFTSFDMDEWLPGTFECRRKPKCLDL